MFPQGKTKIKHRVFIPIVGGFFIISLLIIGWAWSRALFESSKLANQKPIFNAKAKQVKVANIIKEGDISQCDKVKGLIIDGIDYEKVCRNNIARQQATEKLDISACDNLEDPAFSKEDCRLNVTLKLALKQNDPEGCEALTDDEQKIKCADNYWMKQATVKNDIKLCDNVADKQNQVACADQYYLASLRTAPFSVGCLKTSERLRVYCENYQTIMRSGKDCDEVIDLRLRSACQEWRLKNQK